MDPAAAQSKVAGISAAPAPRAQLAPSRYAVQAELARGGMGVVYRVLDSVTGVTIALKRLAPEAAANTVMIRALEREYQVLASLQHPRIIRAFDYGVDELGPYYTMELIEGED